MGEKFDEIEFYATRTIEGIDYIRRHLDTIRPPIVAIDLGHRMFVVFADTLIGKVGFPAKHEDVEKLRNEGIPIIVVYAKKKIQVEKI